MSCCEKCWGNAHTRSLETGKSQIECYTDLLMERRDKPCSAKDQAGEFWDEKMQCDNRHGRTK